MLVRLCFFSLLFILFSACEKGDPVLDETAILSLGASPSSILNYGDTSIITVQAVEADGRPVLDGARIQLSASRGTIDPEVRTQDGLARAVYTSDATPGTVTITATSGSLGGDGATLDLTVEDRNIAVSVSSLSVNPSNLSHAGGTVDIRLVVFGPDGEPLPDKAVVFSADYGRLASNGTTRYSDQQGVARDTLSLSNLPADTAVVQVTGRVADKTETAEITISANETPLPVILSSPQSPLENEDVFFNGSTSSDGDGRIVSYSWDFGDGNTAVGERATHRYAQPGTYTVTLTVVDDLGASQAVSALLSIGNNGLPTADFSYSPETPRVGDIVYLDARTSTDTDGSVVAWHWTMGNGITREGARISYAWPGAGTWPVTLAVTDNLGGEGFLTRDIVVAGNALPVAEFLYSPLSPRVDRLVTFDGSISTDEDGTIQDWRWQFGDGSTGRGRVVEHRYTRSGTFDVLLEVIDDDGGSGFFNDSVTVGDNMIPQAAFSFLPTTPKVDETVIFNAASSSDPDGSIVAYEWDFGDGSTGIGQSVGHIFRQAATRVVSLTVTDNEGMQGTASQALTIGNGQVPVASLRIDPASLTPPGGDLILDGSASTDGEDGLDRLDFYFEAFPPAGVEVFLPGGTSPVRQASIDGMQHGDRVVFTLRVVDRDGNESTVSSGVTASTVAQNTTPQAMLSLSPTTLQAPGGSVILDGSASSDAEQDQLDYLFAAEENGTVNVSLSGSGPIRTATITNGTIGDTVTFSLAVTDELGARDTVYQLLQLTAEPSNTRPTAALQTNPSGTVSVADPGEPIQLTLDASATTDPDQNLGDLSFAFAWNATSNAVGIEIEPNPEAPYVAVARIWNAVADDQLVFTVTVTDAGGLEDTAVVFLTVVEATARSGR